MPRRARITIAKDPRNRIRPWLVNIPASLSQTGKRERPAYVTKGEAERACSNEEERLADYSRRALGLTDLQQIEAAECFSLVGRYAPRSLRDAVRLAVGIWEAEARSVPVDQLAREVETAKGKDGAGRDHKRTIRYTMSGFVEDFAGRSVASITSGEIDRWLRGQVCEEDGEPVSASTRNTFRACLSLSWTFAVTQGWAKENVVSAVRRAKDSKDSDEEDDEVVFLAPEQVDKFLRSCSPRLVAHAALCALAGMRPAEAAKLTWQDIGATEIRVRPTIAKTRRARMIPISKQLGEWLACAWRRPEGIIGFSRADFRKACLASGLVPWPKDSLRHSYGTYRGHLLGEDDLAREMGNSPDIIVKHYRGVSNRETADRYFVIMPNNPDYAKRNTYVPPPQSHRRNKQRKS